VNPSTKKALVVYYSQAGQTERAVQAITSSFAGAMAVDVARIEPREKFAFPWSMRGFFRAFPRCIRGPLPAIEPLKIAWADYDLIVLAYQVWFLSPSLPIQGFLADDASRNLAGKSVLTVATCRNLWGSAKIKLANALESLGAKFLGQITLCEKSPLWASFVTTPRWMLTGKKNAFLFFPPAGINESEFVDLESKLRMVARDWASSGAITSSRSTLTANINDRALDYMDYIGHRFFRFWAALIHIFAPKPGLWQDICLIFFRLNLIALIIFVGPCTKLYSLFTKRGA